MTSKSTERIIAVVVAILGLRCVMSYLIPAFTKMLTDFPNYYVASWAVRQGRPLDLLYDPVWFQLQTEQAGIVGVASLFNYFTPFSALVMWPAAGLAPLAAKQAWTVLSVAAFVGIVATLTIYTEFGVLRILALALLATDALGNNFAFGQFYLVLTLLLLVAVVWGSRWPAVAGFCIAVSTVVKLFPAIFLLYFVLRREWKPVLWCFLFLALLTVVSIGALGWAPHQVFAEEVLPRAVRGELQDPYNVGFNSVQALLRRSFVPEPGLNPQPAIEAPWAFFFLRPLLSFSILALSVAALRTPSGQRPLIAFAILTIMVSLITPSQASYHYVLLIPVAAGMAAMSRGWPRVLYISAFALICSNFATVVPFLRAYVLVAFWVALLVSTRPQLSLRLASLVGALILVISALSARAEMRRWYADETDSAAMVFPEDGRYMEVEPRFVAGKLQFRSLEESGFAEHSVSLYPDGSVDSRSPDGRWIVYSVNHSGNWDVALQDARTGEIRVVTSSAANDMMPVFSPDGRKIYFASDRRRGYRFTAIYEKSLE